MEENFGYLIVSVHTANEALPIPNAMVTVKSTDGDNTNVVAVLYTDSGGMTEKIKLPTPAKANSEAPGGPVPYTLYNIDTDKDGYYKIRDQAVPIYPDTTAIQPVQMIPFSLGQNNESPPEDIVRFNVGGTPNL